MTISPRLRVLRQRCPVLCRQAVFLLHPLPLRQRRTVNPGLMILTIPMISLRHHCPVLIRAVLLRTLQDPLRTLQDLLRLAAYIRHPLRQRRTVNPGLMILTIPMISLRHHCPVLYRQAVLLRTLQVPLQTLPVRLPALLLRQARHRSILLSLPEILPIL